MTSGVDINFRRWSAVETKDAAIMTDNFRLNGSNLSRNQSNAMNGDTIQSRVARYKEERRKQLAGQFANLTRNGDGSSSSSSSDNNLRKPSLRPLNSNLIKDDDVRKPKISNNYKNPNKFRYKEMLEDATDKSKSNGSITSDLATSSAKNNRDKSAKRKSYLNRSANIEKAPNSCHNLSRHLNHSADEGSNKKWNSKNSSSSSLPSPVVVSPTFVSATSSSSSHKISPSPNYRKSVIVNSKGSHSSITNGFAQTSEPENTDRNAVTVKSSVKDGLFVPENRTNIVDKEVFDKSRIPRKIASPQRFSPRSTEPNIGTNNSYDTTCFQFRVRELNSIAAENKISGNGANGISFHDDLNDSHSYSDFEIEDHTNRRNVTSPKEELFSQKNSLLEIIQNFSDKNAQDERNTAEFELRRNVTGNTKYFANSQVHCSSSPQNSLEIIEEDISPKPSILKKKFDERSSSLDLPRPNSILKRKTSEEGCQIQNTRNYRQGILKKYSSLDEDEVRRRSCSPDVDIGRMYEFKPILKTQRRSSLEELVRNRSPELHSILKRSKPGQEDSDSGNSPHGILKRKINLTGSPFSTFNSEGVDSSLKDYFSESDTAVRPILKNKQHSLEIAVGQKDYADTPRPILKKKHSVEVEIDDEKPKKPILKCSRRSLDEDTESFLARESFIGQLKYDNWCISENKGIKPILKKKGIHYMNSRSVKSDDDVAKDCYKEQTFIKRHSLPVAMRSPPVGTQIGENPPSVAERVLNLENFSTEDKLDDDALNKSPRNLRFLRNVERYRTQPITHQEIFSSQSALENKDNGDFKTVAMEQKITDNGDSRNAGDENTKNDVNEEKNILDDKVVISNLKRSNSVSMKASLFSKLENDNRKAAEGIVLKKRDDKTQGRKFKIKCSDLASRFSTQPVTWEEVAEAKKQNLESRSKVQNVIHKEILENLPENDEEKDDISYMSISERVKLFTQKMERNSNAQPKVAKRSNLRFNTQPVTNAELQIAKNVASVKNEDVYRASEEKEKISDKVANISSDDRFNVPNTLNTAIPQQELKSSSEESSPDYEILEEELKSMDSSVYSALAIERQFEKLYLENSSETGSQSEGDTSSSGGREIQQIIGGKYKRTEKSGLSEMNIGPVMSGATDVVDDCPVINGNSSIAQRLAALQRSGTLDWKKRISRIAPENELSPIININETQQLLKKELTNGFRCKATSEFINEERKDGSLAERLEKLETASQTWKKRIEPSDAVKFSVAGKMASSLSAVPILPVTSPLAERKKRTPCPPRFRSFREKKEIRSTPISPEKNNLNAAFNRSNSLPSETEADESNELKKDDCIVSVPQIFDEEFSKFFGNSEVLTGSQNLPDFDTDFNDIKIEKPQLLTTHRKIKAQRKHATSGNPLKTLSTRIEIKNEYREIKTNIAEKEVRRLNVEKLSKNSTLAVEVLAGLASKEDFAAVHLKKAGAPIVTTLLPYKPLMLLHIKGRRHVQTRLVEPIVQSVNSGDSYVLVTPNEVYHWIGQFCNVIEKSRGSEIAQHIAASHDLGCANANAVQTIVEDTSKPNSKIMQNFWIHLGASQEQAASLKAVKSGHPDEDEIYESSLISTNMVYEVVNDELISYEKYWASIPKIEMLDPNKVLVFDFGNELYIWMGKNVDLKLRKSSVKLAKELWNNGYNYEECDLCPITSAITIGDREVDEAKTIKRNSERPEWCLMAKVTQHMETVLFREKFLDWPDFSRVIRAKGKDEDTEKSTESGIDIKPCDAEEMLIDMKITEPDLILEGGHIGRGKQYFDEERKKFCMVTTTNVNMWHITEFEGEEVSSESFGQFYSTSSYIVKWIYSISYTGRELSGQPSKHTVVGRERCVYFCWQGKNASLNEQGAAALLTVELDKEKGVQLRICQGYEPPAFFNLFDGRTVIYKNKNNDKKWRLFICRGEINSEAALLEVSCNIKQLRSKASFVLINLSNGITFVWHGCKVTKEASEACLYIVNNLKEKTPIELGLEDGIKEIVEIKEGSEPKDFFNGLGSSSRKLYQSLMDDKSEFGVTPSLYNLSSNTGTFCATPIWSPCRHTKIVSAYPFLQEDLYSASQPALFLLDTGKELWLWQGWWPEHENILHEEQTPTADEVTQNSDNYRGSATVRWQLERRAAMQTALDYWRLKYSDETIKAFLVWAGLEPVSFTSLFSDWNDRDDVAEMNIMDGRKPGEVLDVEQELARLTQSTYPIEQLLQRPLPDGVDPTKLELYLSDQHFKQILKVTKEEFAALPSWKQTNLKKNAGLF